MNYGRCHVRALNGVQWNVCLIISFIDAFLIFTLHVVEFCFELFSSANMTLHERRYVFRLSLVLLRQALWAV